MTGLDGLAVQVQVQCNGDIARLKTWIERPVHYDLPMICMIFILNHGETLGKSRYRRIFQSTCDTEDTGFITHHSIMTCFNFGTMMLECKVYMITKR